MYVGVGAAVSNGGGYPISSIRAGEFHASQAPVLDLQVDVERLVFSKTTYTKDSVLHSMCEGPDCT